MVTEEVLEVLKETQVANEESLVFIWDDGPLRVCFFKFSWSLTRFYKSFKCLIVL